MANQSYRVLFPILNSGTQLNQGDTVSFDDGDPETLALLAEHQIILASDPSAAATVAADEADTTNQAKGPGQAQNLPGQFD